MSIIGAVVVPHPPLMLPDIGHGQESAIQKTSDAYRVAMRLLKNLRPDAVVIISPHADCYADYFHISPGDGAKGDFSRFHAPGCKLSAKYDAALANAIAAQAQSRGLPAGTQGQRSAVLDHGTMIPLYFLQEELPDIPIVRMALSGLGPLDHYNLGICIAAAATIRVAIIASGDLSHKLTPDGPYGFSSEGPLLDAAITAALQAGDFGALLDIPPTLRESGAECGLSAILMMAGALDGLAVQAGLLSYEGTFGVGYAVATFLPVGADDSRRFGQIYEQRARAAVEKKCAEEDAYIRLARLSIETYVKQGHSAQLPAGLPPEMLEGRAGVFVSLHKEGRLRGCIGTTSPTTANIAEEILQNAISAAVSDPRFAPVAAEELPLLSVKVDVLMQAESIESMAALDPARYGVIVASGRKRGLLLPALEGVDTAEQQVDIAREKAGIPENEPVSLQRFEVIRHE